MKRTVIIVLTLAMAALASPTAARASVEEYEWTRTRRYVGGEVGPLPGWSGCGNGTACFGYTEANWVTLTIEDRSRRRVGGIAHIADYNRGYDRYVPFCGTTTVYLFPGVLRVYLDAPGDVSGLHWHNGPGCPSPPSTGATRGLVRATFTTIVESS